MSVDYIKNLKIDRNNNSISGDLADKRSYPITFRHCELYKGCNTFEEKYATLIYDIISQQLHFYEKNKLYVLVTASEIQNYYEDFYILGAVKTYKKYKDKIEQILKEGTNNRELKIIPSESELSYELKCGYDKKYEEIGRIFHRAENITENLIISEEQKKEMYKKMLVREIGIENIDKPMFTFYKKENPNIIVSAYPILKKSSNPINDIYTGYYFQIKNLITNYEERYNNSMMISYMIDDEKRTRQIMLEMEKEFIKDELEKEKQQRILENFTEEEV